MTNSIVFCDAIEVQLGIGPDMADITGQLQKLIRGSGISEGSLSATVVGSTGLSDRPASFRLPASTIEVLTAQARCPCLGPAPLSLPGRMEPGPAAWP